MSQVSPRKLAPQVEREMFKVFRQALVDCSSEKDSGLFIEALLSESEKIMLSKRLSIMVMLSKGCSYQEIVEVLKVTPTTIAKVQSWNQLKEKPVKLVLRKVGANERAQAFFTALIKSVAGVFTLRKRVYSKKPLI